MDTDCDVPRFVGREWFEKEYNSFVESADKEGGVQVGNKLTIIVVYTHRLERDGLPELMRGVLGYNFWLEDGGHTRLLEVSDEAYLERVDKLVWTIADLIEGVR